MHAPETLASLHDRLEDNRKLLGTEGASNAQPAPTPTAVHPTNDGVTEQQTEEENKDVA